MPGTKLTEALNQLAEARDEILGAGNALYRTMGVDIGDVAEIQMRHGQSIILGGFGYMGLIDDHEKHITFFGMGSTVCKSEVNRVYRPLEQAGYNIRELSVQGANSETLRFFLDNGIVQFASDVVEGKRKPEAAGFVNRIAWDAAVTLEGSSSSKTTIEDRVVQVFAWPEKRKPEAEPHDAPAGP